MPCALRGLRVLVVEDNFLVAQQVRDLLEECGCETVGPVPRVSSALRLVEEGELDGALLDINLGGEYCFPVATLLSERGVPFVFLTGYDNSAIIPPEFRRAPRITKPFDGAVVRAVAAKVFGR
jgi:DNA-binding LytR/AlgR family response regulator